MKQPSIANRKDAGKALRKRVPRVFFVSSRRRHTRWPRDWSSDVCSSDLERYQAITGAFDSIRDDAKRMVQQIADSKIDTLERLSNIWMKVTRGDIPSRFAKIKATYLDVAKDTKDQIQREQTILRAYADFRVALKEAQVLGFELLKKAETALQGSKTALQQATDALQN